MTEEWFSYIYIYIYIYIYVCVCVCDMGEMSCSGMLGKLVGSHTKVVIHPAYAGSRGYR